MPKSKEFISSSDSDSDSGGKPKAKKAKKEKKKPAAKASSSGDGEEMMELGKMKFVSVSEFRGRKFVNIREYYNDKDTGELKPGRKGIALDKPQWEKLKACISEIDSQID